MCCDNREPVYIIKRSSGTEISEALHKNLGIANILMI